MAVGDEKQKQNKSRREEKKGEKKERKKPNYVFGNVNTLYLFIWQLTAVTLT